MFRTLRLVTCASLLTLVGFASGASAADLKVVASFSIIADLAKNVGGDRVEISTLVPVDGDAHVYEPRPADPNRHGNGIEAMSLTHEIPLDPTKLMTFLELVTTNISSGLLRLKGIIALADDPSRPAIAHAVRHRLYPLQRLESWPNGKRTTEIVLIGQDLRKKQINELFKYLAPSSAKGGRRAI